MQQVARFFQETFLFLGSLIRPAVRSIGDNKGLAVLSIVLAFGLWIFVTEAEDPTRTRVFAQDLTIEPVHVPDSVAVVEPLPPVRVRVTVAEDVFDSLTPADFEATVDVEGLTVGEYELPVEVDTRTARGNLRVEAVLPETIEVRLAQLIQKAVPVVIDVEGEPVSGFTMEEPETGDDTVFVSGPQEYVDQVVQATATINVAGRTGPIDQAVRLSPRNSQGILVQGVDLDPALTDVRIEIEQEKFSRSMAVDPVLTGSPADGYNVVSISVNPPVVTIRGEEAFIVGTASIPTKPIDVSGASAEVVKTVSLDLPSGAEVTGGNSVVTVTIEVEPAIGDFQFTVPVTASNLNATLSITGALPSVTVTLRGPLPTLRSLNLSQISATVDLNGLGAGAQHLAVNVTVPAGITVRTVNPAEIDVVLEQR